MKPLIVAATTFEIQDIIPVLEQKQIPYIITGVGMTATAYALGKALINKQDISAIINVGIAGSFDKNIPLGTVVGIKSDTFYELGAEDNDDFLSIEELGFGKATFYASHNYDIKLPIFDAITVNKIHGNDFSINKVACRYPNCKIESMEGAAVYYVCNMENIPCIQVRAISNYVELRNKSSWKIDLALKNLDTWLKNFILEKY